MATKTIVRYRNRNRTVKVRSAGRKKFGSGLPTVPLALIAGMAPITISTYQVGAAHGVQAGGQHFIKSMTGYDMTPGGGWRFSDMKNGLFPILAGVAIHKYIGGSLGINKALGRAGVPLLRI